MAHVPEGTARAEQRRDERPRRGEARVPVGAEDPEHRRPAPVERADGGERRQLDRVVGVEVGQENRVQAREIHLLLSGPEQRPGTCVHQDAGDPVDQHQCPARGLGRWPGPPGAEDLDGERLRLGPRTGRLEEPGEEQHGAAAHSGPPNDDAPLPRDAGDGVQSVTAPARYPPTRSLRNASRMLGSAMSGPCPATASGKARGKDSGCTGPARRPGRKGSRQMCCSQ